MKHKRTALSVLSVALLATIAGNASAARVDYVIDAGVERDDNLLVTAEDHVEATNLRGGIGFLVTQDSSRVQANVDGRVDYWNYGGGLSDTVEARLAGRLDWFLVPESLSFTIENSLEVEAVDRFSPNAPENRQRVNVLSLGPNYHFNWNPTLRGQTELRWIRSDAEVTEEFDSDRLAAAMRVTKSLDPNSQLSANVQAQDVDFDFDLLAEDFRRYDAYVRYQQAGPRLSYGIDAGYSRVEYDVRGSTSHPLLRGDLAWVASARSRLILLASHQLSDAANAAIASITGIDSVTAPPPRLVTGTSVVDASVYEEDLVSLSYAYTGTVHAVSVTASIERIDYIEATSQDEERRGLGGTWSYRTSPTWTVGGHVDWYDTDYRGINQSQDDLLAGLFATRTFSRHWSASLRYTHYRRDSDWMPASVRQNVWSLMVAYRNR